MRLALIPLLIALPLAAPAQDGEPDNTIHAITTLHADGSKTVTVSNPEQHRSDASTYDARGHVMQKVTYTLDDSNQPVSGVIYTADGKPFMKTAYKHDDSNRITEEDDYTMQDQLIRRFVYTFGQDGKVAGIQCFDANGNVIQETAHKNRRQTPPRVH